MSDTYLFAFLAWVQSYEIIFILFSKPNQRKQLRLHHCHAVRHLVAGAMLQPRILFSCKLWQHRPKFNGRFECWETHHGNSKFTTAQFLVTVRFLNLIFLTKMFNYFHLLVCDKSLVLVTGTPMPKMRWKVFHIFSSQLESDNLGTPLFLTFLFFAVVAQARQHRIGEQFRWGRGVVRFGMMRFSASYNTRTHL